MNAQEIADEMLAIATDSDDIRHGLAKVIQDGDDLRAGVRRVLPMLKADHRMDATHVLYGGARACSCGRAVPCPVSKEIDDLEALL